MATKVRIQVNGLTEILDGFRRMPEAFATEMKAGLVEGANVVANRAKILLASGGRSGQLYDGQRASAPGEPPAYRSGKLSESIKVRPGDRGVAAILTVEHPAATTFEYGSKRIAARPFIRPAAEGMRRELESILIKAADRGAKKIGR